MEKDLEAQITENAPDIIRMMMGISQEQEIFISNINVRRERFGNPVSKFIRGRLSYRLGDEDSTAQVQNLPFFFQYFNGNNITTAIKEEPLELKYSIYELFQGSDITPVPHRLKDIPKGIFLSFLGDMMLEEKLVGLPLEERDRLNQFAGEILLNFHLYAENILSKILDNKKILEAIRKRGNAPAIGKAVECFKIIYKHKNKKNPSKDTEKEFEISYLPFAEILDGYKNQLIHGDAGAQNFLGYKKNELWTTENMSLTDLTSLEFGHVMVELAKLATSHNMLLDPENWNRGIEGYMTKQAAKPFKLDKRELDKRDFWGRKALPPFDPELIREVYTLFYTGAVHKPFKRIGYMDRLAMKAPNKYNVWVHERPALGYTADEMGRNMKVALDYITANADRFLWTSEKIRAIEKLRKFLVGIGFVPEKDAVKELLGRSRKAYTKSQ